MAAEAFIAAIAEAILNKISTLSAEYISQASGLGEELNTLHRQLLMIQAKLHDAEKRQQEQESVRFWLRQLKFVVESVDDVLDEFAYEKFRKEIVTHNHMKEMVRNLFSQSNPVIFHFKMISKVKLINRRLDQITKEANNLHLVDQLPLNNMTEAAADDRACRETHPFVDDSTIVGRDQDVSKIMNKLLSPTKVGDNLLTISIVGMGGVGKTALAQKVYNNENVVRHFGAKQRMWVTASHDIVVKRILNEMGEYITGEKIQMSNIQAIVEKLKEVLNGKKYLLVLDDAWCTDPKSWDLLRNALLGIRASNGSKILVTTRSDEVVSAMQANPTHRLSGLTDDDSWIVFKQRAFASGGAKETPDLVDIGRRLVKRCGGLPLALRLLGSLMYSKKIESEWYSTENNSIWESPNHGLRIMPILELSFNHMSPPSLKQCFASCAMLYKDHVIRKEKLIWLWLAQGFLQPFEGSKLEMEDIGNEYFNILLSNSLFHDIEKDKLGNIKRCKMHDLLYHLSYHILRYEIRVLRDTKPFENTIPTPADVLHHPMKDIDEFGKNINCSLIFPRAIVGDMLTHSNNLRVVDFSGTGIKQVQGSIGKLKHLRYFDISGTSIKRLPDSFTKLYHLQTLNVEHCKSMEELPKELSKLINLRHLCLDETNAERLMKDAPIEMGRLVDLQTLRVFVVGLNRGFQIEELGSLNKLRGELRICDLEHVKDEEEAKKANLQRKNLDSLELQWRSRNTDSNNSWIMNHDNEVLVGLQPNSNLKILSIEGFGGGTALPPWMSAMMLLQVLEIKNCPKMKCILQSFESFGGAASLQQLSISECAELMSLPSGLEFCRSLEELRIRVCPKLEYVPAGLLQLHSLSVLEIVGCGRLSSFPEGLLCCLVGLKELKIGGFWGELDTFPTLLCNSCAGGTGSAGTSSSTDIAIEHNHNHRASHLEEVSLLGWPKVKSLPCLSPLNILCLWVHGFGGLEALPEWLPENLRELYLVDCDNLKYLPSVESMQRFTQLQQLYVHGCRLLEERCGEQTGPDWHKIAHISNKYFSG